MFDGKTKVSQGTIGLGSAISYFVSVGYTVSIPLNDNQNYDLLVDDGSKIYKVDVKTTNYIKYGSYTVQIQKIRSNKTINKIYRFDQNSVDYLFILTAKNDKYLIPSKDITQKVCIYLSSKYEKYKIKEGCTLAC